MSSPSEPPRIRQKFGTPPFFMVFPEEKLTVLALVEGKKMVRVV
jgi:hypothetical protein